jgi:hypothetical protein
MANDTTYTGTTNYEDYENKIKEAAAQTRQVSGSIAPLTNYTPSYTVAGQRGTKSTLTGSRKATQEALVSSAKAQQASVQEQAGKAASALEMVGSATLSGVKNLESLQSTIQNQVTSSADSFAKAATKADEYVQASRERVTKVLSELDGISKSITKDLDFAKAQSMQASVQATLGSMKTEERNIASTYGTDSPEYAQFQASKKTALGTVQSNIQASYASTKSAAATAYMNAYSDTATKMNMYVGYQEQQHVDMLQYQETQQAATQLQAAQLSASIEQMKMSSLENLANWIVESPSFTLDVTSMVTELAGLEQAESTAQYLAANQGWSSQSRTINW